MHFIDYTPLRNRCCDDGVVQQPASIHSLSRRSYNSFSHIINPRTVDPLLKDTTDAGVHRVQIRRIEWPHFWGMNSGVTLCSKVKCLSSSVNGIISLTSTLRHQVRDIRDMYTPYKFTSMISIHLLSSMPKIMKIRARLWKLLSTNEWYHSRHHIHTSCYNLYALY